MRSLASTAWVVVLLGALAGASTGSDVLPDGCEPSGDAFTCQWVFDSRTDPTQDEYTFEIPVFARTLAQVTVLLEGQDNGWTVQMLREADAGSRGTDGDGYDRISEARHAPRATTSRVHSETSTHLLLSEPRDLHRHAIEIEVQNTMANGLAFNSGARSLGEFRVTYHAEPLPEGRVPTRPAATRDDPHVQDVSSDARRPELDVQAAWLDDASVGDGLMEAHVAVGDLRGLDFNLSADHEPNGRILWDYEFTVADTPYRVYWNAWERGDASPAWDCHLVEVLGTAWKELTQPACSVDYGNATLTAVFPTQSLGSPGDGVLFTDMRASACTGPWVCTDEDVGETQRYPFALGGPEVWDELNPRLAVPPPAVLAWHQDPLSRENLPDTLQVVGALFAAGTFLAGALVVRRHRRFTRRLLDDVSRIRTENRTDARAALLALGRLQEHVSDLYHKGRITESQHQVVSQRIAFEATQFALRRDLGLDDGEPGRVAPELDA